MRGLSLFTLCLLASPKVIAAQTPEVIIDGTAPYAWLATQSPRCGELIGRVVRRATAFDTADTRLGPLINARAALVDSGSIGLTRQLRDGSAAGTDAAGEFRLRLQPNRMTVLEVKAVGFESALVALDGTKYRAAAVEIRLGSLGFHVPHRGISMVTSRGLRDCAP